MAKAEAEAEAEEKAETDVLQTDSYAAATYRSFIRSVTAMRGCDELRRFAEISEGRTT